MFGCQELSLYRRCKFNVGIDFEWLTYDPIESEVFFSLFCQKCMAVEKVTILLAMSLLIQAISIVFLLRRSKRIQRTS